MVISILHNYLALLIRNNNKFRKLWISKIACRRLWEISMVSIGMLPLNTARDVVGTQWQLVKRGRIWWINRDSFWSFSISRHCINQLKLSHEFYLLMYLSWMPFSNCDKNQIKPLYICSMSCPTCFFYVLCVWTVEKTMDIWNFKKNGGHLENKK